jgi:uncharacterized delta-60 repeat protein
MRWGIIYSLIPILLFAQTVNWIYTLNGPMNSMDLSSCITLGRDGNVYASGFTLGDNAHDFTVISLTPEGFERWVFVYNGLDNYDDYAVSIVGGPDGNLYVAGEIYGNFEDFAVISLNPGGDLRWIYQYDGPGGYDDYALSIACDSNGNIYAAGYSWGLYTYRDFTVISLDPSGNERWVYRFNDFGNDWDDALSVTYGSNGKVYATGYTYRVLTLADFTVISLDTLGNFNWIYRFNGAGNSYDLGRAIISGSDGNIYCAGYTTGEGGSHDFTVLSFSSAGQLRWSYIYDGPSGEYDEAWAITEGPDGNIYTAGYTYRFGDKDIFVVCFDTSGTVRWAFSYDSPGYSLEHAYSITTSLDGLIYVAGSVLSQDEDFLILCIDTTGDLKWSFVYNGTGENPYDRAMSITIGNNGNIYASGFISETSQDFAVVSLIDSSSFIEEKNRTYKIPSASLISNIISDEIYLNFMGAAPVDFKVNILNIYGAVVYDKNFLNAPKFLMLKDPAIKNLKRGTYILRVSTPKFNQTFKIVKID